MSRTSIDLPVKSEHSATGDKLSLLAVFAHPEDESFGPAGTLAKYANEGVQVSLVTATRGHLPSAGELAALNVDEVLPTTRDRSCSCRTSGVRRACFFDYQPGQLDRLDPAVLEDQLVRLIRQVQPQVIVTFGPQGLSGDGDHEIVNQVATAAFHDAGDSSKFEKHFLEGLGAFAPTKLYYCVLPSSLVKRWGVSGLCSVPDAQVTTVLDVSPYAQAMKNALYCQRSRVLDFVRWLMEEQQVQWDREYYSLVESRLNRKARNERDLFAGLR
jgi:LmbE family N-acetylglucosaminyl deacetylase